MRKNVFLFSLLLILCPVMAAAQEAVKTDTVRAELQSDFLETVGDSTDLIVAGEGSNNWFITLWGGVNSLAAEANRHYDNFLDRSRVSFRLSVGKWFTPVWGFRLQMGVGRLSGHSHLLKYYNMYDHAVDHTVIPSEIADNPLVCQRTETGRACARHGAWLCAYLQFARAFCRQFVRFQCWRSPQCQPERKLGYPCRIPRNDCR